MGVFFKCTDSASFVIPKVWFAGDFGATCLDFQHFSSPAGLSCQSISSRLGNAFPSAPNLYSFISFPSLSLTYLSALDFPTSCNLFLFLPFGLPFCITVLSPFWPSPDMFMCLGPMQLGEEPLAVVSICLSSPFLPLQPPAWFCSCGMTLWRAAVYVGDQGAEGEILARIPSEEGHLLQTDRCGISKVIWFIFPLKLDSSPEVIREGHALALTD